jgi:hypothetical protein
LSARIEAQGDLILALVDEACDLTLEELQTKLTEQGHRFGIGTLWRFFDRRGVTSKKDRARKRTRPPRHSRRAPKRLRDPRRHIGRVQWRKLFGVVVVGCGIILAAAMGISLL